jgi:hypothetical protein
MTINWSMESRNNVTFVTVVYESCAPSLDKWIYVVEEIIKDDRYRTGMGFVLDRRKVSAVSSADDVKGALRYITSHMQHFKGSRWAVLQSNLASFGMVRMGQILSENLPITVKIFENLDEAKNWLCSS